MARRAIGGAYGCDDFIDLCHARPFARRRRLGLLSLACKARAFPVSRTIPFLSSRLALWSRFAVAGQLSIGVIACGFQGTAPDAERLVMRPGVQWEQARSPVVWLAV